MSMLEIRRRFGFPSWMRIAGAGLLVWSGLIAGTHSVLAQESKADAGGKVETVDSPAAKPVRTGKPEFLPRRSKSEQTIINALDKPTEVAFQDNPLNDALNYLKDRHEIEIWIDTAQVNPDDVTVTLETSKVSLRSCLNLILEPHGLCFLVEDDVLKVTSLEYAENKFITRTYPVGDLFESAEDAQELTELLQCGLGLSPSDENPRPLMISTTARVLVIRQTHQVHDQLLQLLRNLRDERAEDSSHEFVLNVGFERDTNGRKKSEIPVVFYNESYVGVPEFGDDLEDEKSALTEKFGPDAVGNTTVLIRADPAVPFAQIQQLFKKCEDAGFTKFSLRATSEE